VSVTDVRELVEGRARAARAAARVLATAATRVKNEALALMARGVEEKAGTILEANRADLERARGEGHPRAPIRGSRTWRWASARWRRSPIPWASSSA
jgi:hypothetical protein